MSSGQHRACSDETPGFEAYKIWKPLHVHFTDARYNIFESKARIKGLSVESFLARPDRQCFEALAQRVDSRTAIGRLLLASYVVGRTDVIWNFTPEVHNIVQQFIARRKSLTYQLQQAIGQMEPNWLSDDPYSNGLFNLTVSQQVYPEVTVVLDRKLNVIDNWVCQLKGTSLETIVQRLAKYRGFVQYDESRLQKLYSNKDLK